MGTTVWLHILHSVNSDLMFVHLPWFEYSSSSVWSPQGKLQYIMTKNTAHQFSSTGKIPLPFPPPIYAGEIWWLVDRGGECVFGSSPPAPVVCWFLMLFLGVCESLPISEQRRPSSVTPPGGSEAPRPPAEGLAGACRWACCTWDRRCEFPATSPDTSCETHENKGKPLVHPGFETLPGKLHRSVQEDSIFSLDLLERPHYIHIVLVCPVASVWRGNNRRSCSTWRWRGLSQEWWHRHWVEDDR